MMFDSLFESVPPSPPFGEQDDLLSDVWATGASDEDTHDEAAYIEPERAPGEPTREGRRPRLQRDAIGNPRFLGSTSENTRMVNAMMNEAGTSQA